MLSNEYLVAKFGFDTEENEPLKVWGVMQFIIQFSPYWRALASPAASTVEAPAEPSTEARPSVDVFFLEITK